jgi:hypothetical protein
MSFRSLLIFALISAFSAPHRVDAQASDRRMVIKSFLGTVKIRRGQSVNWMDARPNMPVKEQDAVRTYVESEATLQISDGSIITLGENSTFELAALKQSAGAATDTRIKILNGSVLSNIQKLANVNSRFEFETPTATASIRGTRLGIDVAGEQTDIRVYEGKVLVKPAGSQAGKELNANEMTSVKKGQRVVEIEALKEKSATMPGPKSSDSTKTPADSAKSRTDSAATQGSTAPARDSATTAAATATASPMPGATPSPVPRDTSALLKLMLIAPAEGATASPGARVEVAGRVLPATAQVTVNGARVTVSSSGDFKIAVSAPLKPGDFPISVEAIRGTQTQSVQRQVTVQALAAPTALRLIVNSPKDAQVFATMLIPVNGITTPGAEVTCSGIKCKVGSDGAFAGQVPIPDEPGEMDIDVEASLGSMTQRVTRAIVYKRDETALALHVFMPVDGQKLQVTSIPVSGQVMPASATVSVDDRPLPVASTGSFSGTASIPNEPGEHTLTFEATSADKTIAVSRKITYERPPDTERPVVQGLLPLFSKAAQLSFTVFDRTADDEITFYQETDGSRESQIGQPNSQFIVDLDPGLHLYSVYATDKQGNQSARLTGKVCYLSRLPTIRLMQPAGDYQLRIPPRGPESDFVPRYTVRFSIENLPDDQPATLAACIKEVRITNAATGRSTVLTNITDNDIEQDIELKLNAANPIEIRITDITQNAISRSFTLFVK